MDSYSPDLNICQEELQTKGINSMLTPANRKQPVLRFWQLISAFFFKCIPVWPSSLQVGDAQNDAVLIKDDISSSAHLRVQAHIHSRH